MAPPIKYTKLFINNEWVDSKSKKTFNTYTPHTGAVIAQVAEGDKADVDLAVAAARRAFHRNSEWRLLDASQRGELLRKFANLVERDAAYIAELESYNNGMILTLATGIMHGAVKRIRYLASCADKIQGDTLPVDSDGDMPDGVCGLILPCNFPVLMFVNKVCTDLAAGYTIVVKPAEQTPLTALALAALLAEAGVPKGVVNIINGYGPTAGVALTHHPDVAKISFTGSSEVGKLIQKAARENNLMSVTLQLVGKSTLDDADFEVAVPSGASFLHQMHICITASRLYTTMYDKFAKAAMENNRWRSD